MKQILILVCFLGLSRALPHSGQDSAGIKLVGGKDAGEFEFPHQVSVRVLSGMGGKTHICGGSLYNETIIVTSALCLQRQNIGYIYGVLAGNYDIFTYLPGEQPRTVEQVVVHPLFNRSTYDFDIAYLRLREDSALVLNDRVKPIQFADSAPYGNVTFIGWGLHDPDWDTSAVVTGKLQKVTLQITDSIKCRFSGAHALTQNMICASSPTSNLCARDAGGPLLCQQGGQVKVCGIASWGERPCTEQHATVFTNIAKVRSWLESELGSNFY